MISMPAQQEAEAERGVKYSYEERESIQEYVTQI